MNKIMQLDNLIDSTVLNGFSNPQRGRVYSTEGIAPTLITYQGGAITAKDYCKKYKRR